MVALMGTLKHSASTSFVISHFPRVHHSLNPHRPKDFIVLKRSAKTFLVILWAFSTCSESGELIGFRLRGHWRSRLPVHVGPILVSKLAYRPTPVANFPVQNVNFTTTVLVSVC